MKLTIFYDGTCPLCVAEMNLLRQYDSNSALRLENLYDVGFSAKYPQIDKAAANTILHGMNAEGKLLYGLDVTVAAWSLVGRKKWLRVLRWPIIRWFADRAYLFFARNRYRISKLFTGKDVCGLDGKCGLRPKASANCARNVNEDAEF